MSPYYEQDGITIYLGDCRDVLPSVTGDALVTDPPYGIAWGRATWEDDPAAYTDLMRWLVAEGKRIGGWCFVFQSMPNCHRWHEWFPEGWRIFAACKNFAQIRPTGIFYSWDPVIFWNSGPNNGRRRDVGHINRDYCMGDVAGLFTIRADHPTMKPINTMQHIVQLATGPSEIIIDPFAGSGSTLVAAKQVGRAAIGIEIKEQYCEIAAKRLAQRMLPMEWPA